jgi:hypothetical protein
MAMRALRSVVLAAVAAFGVGFAGAASAQTANVMTVRLPGGGLAEIRYVGDVPPQVVFAPTATTYDSGLPASSLFGRESPFAAFERISAEMDRQAAAMFRYAAALADQAQAGQGYAYASAMPADGGCLQGVRITQVFGAPPRVETYSAGNCTRSSAPGGTVRLPVGPAAPPRQPELLDTYRPGPVAPSKQPDLILTQGTGTAPYAGMVRHVAAAR